MRRALQEHSDALFRIALPDLQFELSPNCPTSQVAGLARPSPKFRPARRRCLAVSAKIEPMARHFPGHCRCLRPQKQAAFGYVLQYVLILGGLARFPTRSGANTTLWANECGPELT